MTFPMPFLAKARPATSIAYCTSAIYTTSDTSHTFASQSIGTAARGRLVIVSCYINNSSDPTSVSVGGVSLTKIGSVALGANNCLTLWAGRVDTGTTANITVTSSSSVSRWGIGVWAAYDIAFATPFDVKTDIVGDVSSYSVLLNIPKNGVALVIVGEAGGSSNTYPRWTFTGATERYDTLIAVTTGQGGGDFSSASAVSGKTMGVTSAITSTGRVGAILAASFT